MKALNLRELNRTLLARQLLLQRETCSIMVATAHLVALQAQIPNPPYIGLWTRLKGFERDDLTGLMEKRQIVRAPLLRSTLHLVTAEDHQRVQPTLQPALDRALKAFFGKKAQGLDIAALVNTARDYLDEAPRSMGEIRERLLEIAPDRDGAALAYAVRNNLPLVQVPPGGTWGAGSRANYVTAASWLGTEPAPVDLRALLHRYLAAFGPASVMDFQTWTGLTSLKRQIEPLKAELVIYQDEDGKELLDVPDMSVLPEDTLAPVRFIPEYDNLLISHADRRRIIADEDRPKVFLSAGRIVATILVDGFVAGTWKTVREKKIARLLITPFRQLSVDSQATLETEGGKLIRFIEDDAERFEVQFEMS